MDGELWEHPMGAGLNGTNLSPEWGYIQQPRASVSAALGLW